MSACFYHMVMVVNINGKISTPCGRNIVDKFFSWDFTWIHKLKFVCTNGNIGTERATLAIYNIKHYSKPNGKSV